MATASLMLNMVSTPQTSWCRLLDFVTSVRQRDLRRFGSAFALPLRNRAFALEKAKKYGAPDECGADGDAFQNGELVLGGDSLMPPLRRPRLLRRPPPGVLNASTAEEFQVDNAVSINSAAEALTLAYAVTLATASLAADLA